jgi:hypothetical protein
VASRSPKSAGGLAFYDQVCRLGGGGFAATQRRPRPRMRKSWVSFSLILGPVPVRPCPCTVPYGTVRGRPGQGYRTGAQALGPVAQGHRGPRDEGLDPAYRLTPSPIRPRRAGSRPEPCQSPVPPRRLAVRSHRRLTLTERGAARVDVGIAAGKCHRLLQASRVSCWSCSSVRSKVSTP